MSVKSGKVPWESLADIGGNVGELSIGMGVVGGMVEAWCESRGMPRSCCGFAPQLSQK